MVVAWGWAKSGFSPAPCQLQPLGETLDKAAALAPLGSAPVREKGAEMEEGRLVLEERNTSRSLGATPKSMHAFSHFIISISVFALKTSVVQVVAARSSAFSREARYLLAFAFKLSECLSRSSDALIGSCRASHARQATREKRVRDPIHYCNMCLALHARTSEGRGDPRSPSHTADALIGSCRASHAR